MHEVEHVDPTDRDQQEGSRATQRYWDRPRYGFECETRVDRGDDLPDDLNQAGGVKRVADAKRKQQLGALGYR
jgi:hypothetical protein